MAAPDFIAGLRASRAACERIQQAYVEQGGQKYADAIGEALDEIDRELATAAGGSSEIAETFHIRLKAALQQRAAELAGCTEGSPEELELQRIADLLELYEDRPFMNAAGGIQVGDVLTIPDVALSRRERFFLWLRRPWRIPAKRGDRRMVVTATTNAGDP